MPKNTPPDRLYGQPFSEHLWPSIVEVYEHQIEGDLEGFGALVDHEAHATIEEHTVVPSRDHLPSPHSLLEYISEWVADNGEVDEYWHESLDGHSADPDVVAATEALLQLLASKVTYWMADKVVATHTITWDETGPLVNGEPLYQPAPLVIGTPHDPNQENRCPLCDEPWPCAERKRQRQEKKELQHLLHSDLYERVDLLPTDDGGIRYRSPLGWSVWFNYGEESIPLTIRAPDGKPFKSTTSGSIDWLEANLP